MKRAVFLDRDGTVIEEAHYLADPDRIVIVPGVPEALRRLQHAGWMLVIVTNQSGIARGLYSEADFHAVQQRLEEMLAEQGVRIDMALHCPHHPDFSGPCDCRKPALGMYRRAAEALDIDLAGSVYVGDRVKDVLPALETGGRGFLVRTGYGADEAAGAPAGVDVKADVAEVAEALSSLTGPVGKE